MTFMLLFACSPLDPRTVDDSYADEYRCAQEAGFEVGVINIDALLSGDPQQAVKRLAQLPRVQTETALYRGWMLRPAHYEQLYVALLTCNLRLINSPQQYTHTHHLPESYTILQGYTPKSIWLPLPDAASLEEAVPRVVEAVRLFADRPIIVKDYVKSRKHEWEEACYIADASDRDDVMRVVRRFVELQDRELNEGLVFREFEALEHLSVHPQSGMPLSREVRVFVFDGRPLYVSTYWQAGEDEAFNAVLGEYAKIMQSVESRFFTIDFAKKKNGPWIVLELGDGQVAGLPDETKPELFYKMLKEAVE